MTPDYPTEALIDHIEGVVSFRLVVDTSGRVEECQVVVSSGSDLLDATACNLITQRARFSIARDARGRPVKGSYSNRVRWVLPKEKPQPRPLEFEGTFVVQADGTVTDCQILHSNGLSPQDLEKMQTPCLQEESTVPFLDESGNPVRRRIRVKNSVSIEPVP